RERCLCGERALHRRLDRRPVGIWIRKRHTQFDHVGARVRTSEHHLARAREIGIAGGDIDYQRLLARKPVADSAHSDTPNALARVVISLSPRPDTLTTMTFAGPMRGAISRKAAIAWALSSAGMMPSLLARSSRPSSASRSVTLTYVARPESLSQAC